MSFVNDKRDYPERLIPEHWPVFQMGADLHSVQPKFHSNNSSQRLMYLLDNVSLFWEQKTAQILYSELVFFSFGNNI